MRVNGACRQSTSHIPAVLIRDLRNYINKIRSTTVLPGYPDRSRAHNHRHKCPKTDPQDESVGQELNS